MSIITKSPFEPDAIKKLRSLKFNNDWPVVYLLEDGQEMYIGETVSAYSRFKQHYENLERRKLSTAYVIADEEYNKSATLDIESNLIQFIAADGKYKLQNGNSGLTNHSYYDREKYSAKFDLIWKELQDIGIASNDLVQIKNSDVFKYSPYKALTDEQLEIVRTITHSIKDGSEVCHVVNGEPGTGKSVLAVYLVKRLLEKSQTKNMKIALVIPMTPLRKTLKKVFRSIKGLSPNMVVGPNEIVGGSYDVLIVDEAHRLRRRVNLSGYKPYDDANASLGLGNEGTQLDWVMLSSRSQVLLYDKGQSVTPGDIRGIDFTGGNYMHHKLSSQLRISAGQDYLQFIDDILSVNHPTKQTFEDYSLLYFDNLADMVDLIKQQDKKHGLSRLVAGYAWTWQTKNKGAVDFDIELDGLKLKWNSVNVDWVNSKNAIDEVGCIHTVQGYDLNYVGVIIGPELSYDEDQKKLIVDKSKYMDINGKRTIESEDELFVYIINIYKTLLARGIKGTYIHAVDKGLAKYLKNLLNTY